MTELEWDQFFDLMYKINGMYSNAEQQYQEVYREANKRHCGNVVQEFVLCIKDE